MPYPVVRRLARYRAYLSDAKPRRQGWISSKEFAADLGLTSATVRKDISYLKFRGLTSRGYNVRDLGKVLSATLGLDRKCNVVIVGAGNLGRALAVHGDLARLGFKTCGVFDTDPRLQHRKVAAFVIQSMAALPTVINNYGVSIGIIAVPASAAQAVADQLVDAGVRGLLNLACVNLTVPERVAVVEARIAGGLAELCCCVRSAAIRESAAVA
jgi:redox-sensing transcriptional repressor